MQDATLRSVLLRTALAAKRSLFPVCLLTALAAEPLAVGLFAAESPADEAKTETKIAKKVDEGTSLASEKPGNHPLIRVLDLAKSSRASVRELKDYTGTFIKRERIKTQLTRHNMEMKFRQEPFSVYLRYHEPNAGREVIYVDGKNKGKLLVHEDGFKALAGTLAFLPTCEDALAENKYPITQIGMANMLDLAIAIWEQDLKHREVEAKFYPNAKVGTTECKMVETIHPQARPHFKFHKTCLYIDKKTNLPIRLEQYGFPPNPGEPAPLHEEYTYTNLKTNVGLNDHDFDTKNKDYNF